MEINPITKSNRKKLKPYTNTDQSDKLITKSNKEKKDQSDHKKWKLNRNGCRSSHKNKR